MSSWQRYTSPAARERMEKNLCPECGAKPDEHTGRGTARCSLTDTGVAGRIWQYDLDREHQAKVEQALPLPPETKLTLAERLRQNADNVETWDFVPVQLFARRLREIAAELESE